MSIDFEDLRPYYDHEINSAMIRIANNPIFENVVNYLYPGVPLDKLKAMFASFQDVKSFQIKVMNHAIQNILKTSSKGLTYSGVDLISYDTKYLYISNHRDILLDSAILQVILHHKNYDTSEITFGDNLMSSPFLVDVGRSNKMFRLIRGGTPKEVFSNSLRSSHYIRFALTRKNQSIWIAQRNGRTKDGKDQTQLAVLKMFAMSGQKDFIHDFSELNLAPISISYEYEPCDAYKTREIYISRRQTYVKEPGEDLRSILHGIKQFKGRIHLSFTRPIQVEELHEIGMVHKNEQASKLAALIDQRIFENYKLWNTNFIAYDLLNEPRFETRYTQEEKNSFIEYMKKSLKDIEGDVDELEDIFLNIYANSVVNCYRDCPGSQHVSQDAFNFEYA